MRRRGPKHGARQRLASAYDPTSGRSLSASAYFPPDVAAKLVRAVPTVSCPENSGESLAVSVKLPPEQGAKAHRAAVAADLSVSGLLVELVRRMPVDTAGRPVEVPPDRIQNQDALPLGLRLAAAPRSSQLSVNGLLRQLVQQMQVDTSHRPDWLADSPAQARQLMLPNETASAA